MTKKILVTHIGAPKTTNQEYPRTRYQLGETRFETSMIGFGLIPLLQPEEVILLGTTGSLWSALPFMAGMDQAIDEALTDTMTDLEEAQQCDQRTDAYTSHLIALSQALSLHFGCQVHCQLVPYMDGNQVNHQTAKYLSSVQAWVPENAKVTLDVTHGLRYLPMLALLSAAYMRVTRNVDIEQILYGAVDRRLPDGSAAVIQLDSLLQVIDWISALNSFDKDGDYSVFAPLLEVDGVPSHLTRALQNAAYCERISNASQAKEKLQPVKQHTFDESTPLSELFEEQLKERLAWTNATNRGDIEFRLADQYLKRKDYLRACIYAQEGYVSKRVSQQNGNLNDYLDRDNASQSIELTEYRTLKRLRNALAHGIRNENRELRAILANEQTLESTLRTLFQALRKAG